MREELEAARKHPLVIASVVAAALSVTVLALAGAAVLLGWVGPRAAIEATAPPPAPRPPATGAAPAAASGIVLLPGETLVEPPGPPAAAPARREPLMPAYTPPAAPPPAPKEVPRLVEKAPATEREPEPAWPQAGAEHPSSPFDTWPQPPRACRNCGEVVRVVVYPDLVELRVEFDDGRVRRFRYEPPSPFRLGERVRLERGRLHPQ